jgi:hypothetical protein
MAHGLAGIDGHSDSASARNIEAAAMKHEPQVRDLGSTCALTRPPFLSLLAAIIRPSRVESVLSALAGCILTDYRASTPANGQGA